MSILPIVCCLSLVAGMAPAVAATKPAGSASHPGVSAGRGPTGTRNATGLLGAATPANGSLVVGRPLHLRVHVSRGARLTSATVNFAPVLKHLHRRHGDYVGTVPNVPAGAAGLHLEVRKGARQQSRDVQFTVRGRHADLLSAQSSSGGLLAAAQSPGVAPVAFAAKPQATVLVAVNGRRVDNAAFGPALPGGVRRFVASRTDGLHHGRNTVVTTAFLANGEWDTQQQTVVVPNDSPLAEGGTSGLRQQGSVLRLDASHSVAAIGGSRPTYSWRLVQAPSDASGISDPAARVTSLRLTRPGTYAIALTVNQTVAGHAHRSTDLISVTALKQEPAAGARLQTLVPDTADLPPAKQGGSTSGVGTIFDGYFRAYADSFGDAPAGMYIIDPQTLYVTAVKLPGTGFDNALTAALKTVAKDSIVVLELRAGATTDSAQAKTGPYSHIVAYDGDGLKNFWNSGTTNDGLRLDEGSAPLSEPGSVDGYLRVVLNLSKAQTGYRFVRDGGQVDYATQAPNTATGGPDVGATYRLINVTTHRAIEGGDSAPLQTASPGSDSSQQWQLVRGYGELYKIVNRVDGRCLELADKTGPDTVAGACDPSTTSRLDQLWLPSYDTSSHSYRLVSAAARDAVDSTSSSTVAQYLTDDGGKLVMAHGGDDRWNLNLPPGLYTIRVQSPTNTQAGKALAEPDYDRDWNSQLRVAAPNGQLNQLWQVVDGPTNDGSDFALRNVASGLCADVPDSAVNDGGAVNRYQCHPSDDDETNQLWTTVPTRDGLELHSVATEEGLAADGNGTVTQQQIDVQAPVKQTWSLERAPEPTTDGGASYGMSMADGSGRILRKAGVGQTAAPQSDDVVLTTLGDGKVQIHTLDDSACLERADGQGAPQWETCSDRVDSWRTHQWPDGTTTVVDGDAADRGLDVNGADPQVDSDPTHFLLTGVPDQLQVGEQRYTTSAAPGQSGFAMLAFDQTLQPVSGYPISVDTSVAGGHGAAVLTAALNELSSKTHDTILLQSYGHPYPTDDAWNGLAAALSKFGIDGRSVLQLNETQNGSFAAAGCNGCTNAPTENSVTADTGDKTGGASLAGELGWSPDSTREPLNGGVNPAQQSFGALANRGRTQRWPFDTAGPDRDAVDAIAPDLGPLADTCHEPGTDAIRNAYCSGDNASITDYKTRLVALTYSAVNPSGAGYSQGDFDTVKQQLLREFDDVSQVNDLFDGHDGVQTMLEQELASTSSSRSPSSAAAAINSTIYQPSGPTPRTKDDPTEHGGVLDFLASAIAAVKDVTEYIPVVPVVARRPGSDPEPEEPDLGKPVDSVVAGLLLLSSILELTGGNSDGSQDLSLDIDGPFISYFDSVTNQLNDAIVNMDTTRDMILSDPTELAAASLNHTGGTWHFDTYTKDVTIQSFERGIVSDVWPRQLGIAFQTLRWPVLPDGYRVTDMKADGGQKAWHYIYHGIPDSATAFPVSKVSSTGKPVTRSTYVLTRLTSSSFVYDSNRVIAPWVLDEFYRQTDYYSYDLITLPPLRAPAKPGCDDFNFNGCIPGGNSVYVNHVVTQKEIYMNTLPKDW